MAVLGLLVERFPTCFATYEPRRKPLKIGIHKDLALALNGSLGPREIAAVMQLYCNAPAYLRRLVDGANRVSLDGRPVGVVSAAEEADAKKRLAELMARHARRRAAKKKAPPPAAPTAADPARRQGDGLAQLRAAAKRRREAAEGTAP
jgi:ProP effector